MFTPPKKPAVKSPCPEDCCRLSPLARMVPVILSYKASKLPPLDILPAFALSGSVSINKPDLLFCRLVKLVDRSIYLPICGLLIFLFHANNNRNDPSVKKDHHKAMKA